MILNNNSKFVISALKCMEVFPFVCFRISLLLVKTGWLVSWKFRIIFAVMEFNFLSDPYSLVPDHFHSSPGSIKVQWSFWNLLWVSFHFLWIRSTNFFIISFLSNQCRWILTWRWFCQRIVPVRCSAFANHSGSLEESVILCIDSLKISHWRLLLELLHLTCTFCLRFHSWRHFPKTHYWIWVDSHFCLWPANHLIMCWSVPCPTQWSAVNCLHIQYV